MAVNINCDMGESFGLYRMGNDAELMPHIDEANVACGFHASDPSHMRATVRLAKEHGVQIGAHPGLPDLVGFGRREMKIGREELFDLIMYQIGALYSFVKLEGAELSHLKPHGALYGMAARQEETAQAVADAAEAWGLPVMGMPNTMHEEVYPARGLTFVSEFFVDLDYDDEGRLVITREHHALDAETVLQRTRQAVREGTLTTTGGKTFPVRADSICFHSDTPGATDIAKTVRAALVELEAA